MGWEARGREGRVGKGRVGIHLKLQSLNLPMTVLSLLNSSPIATLGGSVAYW